MNDSQMYGLTYNSTRLFRWMGISYEIEIEIGLKEVAVVNRKIRKARTIILLAALVIVLFSLISSLAAAGKLSTDRMQKFGRNYISSNRSDGQSLTADAGEQNEAATVKIMNTYLHVSEDSVFDNKTYIIKCLNKCLKSDILFVALLTFLLMYQFEKLYSAKREDLECICFGNLRVLVSYIHRVDGSME